MGALCQAAAVLCAAWPHRAQGLHPQPASPTRSGMSTLGGGPAGGKAGGGLASELGSEGLNALAPRPSHLPDVGPDGSLELEDEIQRSMIAGVCVGGGAVDRLGRLASVFINPCACKWDGCGAALVTQPV